MARSGNIETTSHRKHLRYQRFRRLRRQDTRFYDFLNRMGIKFQVTAHSIRDTIQNIGPFEPQDLEVNVPPPVPGVASQVLAGVGTSWSDPSENGVVQFNNPAATFVTDGFEIGMNVALEAGGPSFTPGDFLSRLSGRVRGTLSETQLKLFVKEGVPIPTGTTQIGDILIFSQIKDDSP